MHPGKPVKITTFESHVVARDSMRLHRKILPGRYKSPLEPPSVTEGPCDGTAEQKAVHSRT